MWDREYCVQYRETDFNFISRLMEEDGIFYFLEHENGKYTMVSADNPGRLEASRSERCGILYERRDSNDDVVNDGG